MPNSYLVIRLHHSSRSVTIELIWRENYDQFLILLHTEPHPRMHTPHICASLGLCNRASLRVLANIEYSPSVKEDGHVECKVLGED